MASQDDRLPSLCSNVSLLLKSYVLRYREMCFKRMSTEKQFYIRICSSLVHVPLARSIVVILDIEYRAALKFMSSIY